MYQVLKGGTRALPHLQPEDYLYSFSQGFLVRRLGLPQHKIVQRLKVSVEFTCYPRCRASSTNCSRACRICNFEVAQ